MSHRKSRKSKHPIARGRGGLKSLLKKLTSSHRSSSHRSKKRSTSRSAARSRMLTRLRKTFIVVPLIALAVGLIAVIVRSVLNIKTGVNSNNETIITLNSTGEVVGLNGIPAYPGSEFLFEENVNESVVQRFLSRGESAYLLPEGAEWEDVVTYYTDELPQRGWSHVLTVPIADEKRRPGEYWVFESAAGQQEPDQQVPDAQIDDPNAADPSAETADETTIQSDVLPADSTEPISLGLRIYSKVNSIWYERITVAQARSGLADEVAQDEEINLLLQMGSMKDLPESFPWKLSYPEMWGAEIEKSRFNDISLVSFSGGTDETTVTIEPFAYDTGKTLEEYGNTFLSDVNAYRPENDSVATTQTEQKTIAGQPGLVLYLTGSGADTGSGDESEQADVPGYAAFVIHPGTGVVYAVYSFDGELAFFTYVVEHLEVR